MDEKTTNISYDRLAEIATRLKDMLKDVNYTGSEIVDILNYNYDLDLEEHEIEFLGIFDDDDEEDDW